MENCFGHDDRQTKTHGDAVGGRIGRRGVRLLRRGGKVRGRKTCLAPGRAAFSFRRQDVATLALQRDGQRTVIESRGNNWVITQPVDAPAVLSFPAITSLSHSL
jgi:hypothetical protein